MRARDKASRAFGTVCSLAFAASLLAGLPGFAGAQLFNGGVIDFCSNDPNTGLPFYDNALDNSGSPPYTWPQSFGSFTDVAHTGWTPSNTATKQNRPNQINVFTNMRSTTNPGGTNPWGDSQTKPATCAMNFYGNSGWISNGHADMWIAILAPPMRGVPLANNPNVPMTNCWGLSATVWFDNVGSAPNPWGNGGWNNGKYVGIVTNFNPLNNTGLFLGLFDAGNTERLELLQFDASVDYSGNMSNPTVIASKALRVGSISSTGDGGSTFNSTAYVVRLDICTAPDQNGINRISALASVQPAVSNYKPGTCPNDYSPDQQCFTYNGLLPAGIVSSGAVGIATLAPTSGAGVVDTYVSKFTFSPSNRDPD